MSYERREARDRRIGRLVDRNLMGTDAYYNAQVRLFRNWLVGAEMAMEDEGVDLTVIERVLNRMIYGTPSGAEAYERIENDAERLHLTKIMGTVPPMRAPL